MGIYNKNEKPLLFITGETGMSIKGFAGILMDIQTRYSEYRFVGLFNDYELHAYDYGRAVDLVDYYYQQCEDEDDEE
jgi:hypothetical protein